jgi:hypothetical protein
MSSGRQQQQQQSFNDTYTALIIEESEKLYNNLITKLTNDIIASSTDIGSSSLPATNSQKLTYRNDTYTIEKPRHINQSEIYNNNQKQRNETNDKLV